MISSKKQSKETLINRLLERGVEDIVDKDRLKEALFGKKKLRVKFGIDPTSPNLHLGRAVPLRKLRDFQNLGHTVVLIVGDFTAQIGDPSDKLAKRPMLQKEKIKEYLKGYKKQLNKIIDLSKAEFHFNSKWLGKLGFQEISELAECFSVGQMIERRNFKDRFESHEEISLREFIYPLMQGYDSVAVKADVEIGGFDQLFNLKAGRVIQKHYGEKQQDIMILGMLEGTDGRKMSSSWGNVIALTDSAEDMFGKIMSLRDELIIKYFTLCTDVSEEDISEIEKRLALGMNPRDAKVMLSKEIVRLYHGVDAGDKAAEEFDKVFRGNELPSEIEDFSFGKKKGELMELLISSHLCASKSEARRLVEQGGVKVSGSKASDISEVFSIPADGLIIQAGKRKFVRIIN